jgi:hypothetical protein
MTGTTDGERDAWQEFERIVACTPNPFEVVRDRLIAEQEAVETPPQAFINGCPLPMAVELVKRYGPEVGLLILAHRPSLAAMRENQRTRLRAEEGLTSPTC